MTDYDSGKEIFKIIANKITVSNYDTICDIATGSGYSISLLSKYLPFTTTYMVEDINKKSCNEKAFKRTFNFFKSNNGLDQFRFAIGTPTTIPYSDNSFKNVTLFISLHEFSNTEKMLNEVKRIMQKEGNLHILESVYQHTPAIDSVCKFTYLSEKELYDIVKKANLKIVTDTTFYKKTDTTNLYSKYLICKKQ